ncbi:MAG TPA: NAD(P)-binding domain-containing protein, partial [Puia sp.]|nr:NAD(P)-binding domain-containing protein [Puia sp.]
MKTVIIGAGNVATVLGEIIIAAGHPLLQIVARDEARAAALARGLGCAWTTRYADIETAADLYIVALSDSALEELGRQLRLRDRLVVHTAGAASANV